MDNSRSDSNIFATTSTTSPVVQKIKKRRLHGSCDTCRKKKIKCDSANMPNNHCTNCLSFNIRCEHTIPRQKKKRSIHVTPQNNATYIQNLQDRLEKLEKLLQEKQRPEGVDNDSLVNDIGTRSTSQDLSPFPTSRKSPLSDLATSPSPVARLEKSRSRQSSVSSVSTDHNSDIDDYATLAHYLGQLSIKNIDDKFFGKSSAFMFVTQASSIRSEITGFPNKPDPTKFRRPIYWDLQPWELDFAMTAQLTFVFPEPDLLMSLVDIYFDNMNILFPLLHRPTFIQSLMKNEHTWDQSFGMTVLMVCAIAARYSSDPRVQVPGDASGGFSAGWNYFTQTQVYPNSLFSQTTLYHLQYYCLAVIYLTATAVTPAAWNILGLGLRYAIEKSAHRRNPTNQKPNAQSELLKRAFWCMLCIDRLKASFLGRPCMLHEEDFDTEYPIECDDEYWETEDPELAFKQPEGKPCKISSFVCLIKLCEILASSLKSLYPAKKSKSLLNATGEEWERGIVTQLDSAMNKWKDSLPQCLVWNSNIHDLSFFHQSVLLHVTYYYVQIVIHQPFLTKKSALAYPSLALCTNSSRSCIHILESAVSRGIHPTHHLVVAAFSSGIVVVLNLWGHQRSGLVIDTQKEKEDLQRCMDIFEECEKKKWVVAGRLRDLLTEVASLNSQHMSIDNGQQTSYDMGATTELSLYEDPSPYNGGSSTSSMLSSFPSEQGTFGPGVPLSGDSRSHLTEPIYDQTPSVTSSSDFGYDNYSIIQNAYPMPHITNNTPEHSVDEIHYSWQTSNVIASERSSSTMGSTPEISMSEDTISLFSNMPAAFSADDWDVYLRALVARPA